MLDNILSKYSSKNALGEENIEFDNREAGEFLNEEENLSDKKKCEDVMKKFCSLYADEEEADFRFMRKNESNKNKISMQNNNDKYSIKPLNYKFLEQKTRREENAKTTGDAWFNMKAPEMTEELKEDLKAVQLRHVIDPSRFYKKMDRNNLPKFFQMGTIMDNITDGKKNRLKSSEIKSRLVEEFLEEDKEKNYSIRKFEEIQKQRRNLGLKKTKLDKYKLKNKGKSRKTGFVVK
jgi:hypothetical protein